LGEMDELAKAQNSQLVDDIQESSLLRPQLLHRFLVQTHSHFDVDGHADRLVQVV